MDKSAIKNFAVNARNKLIQGVTQKAYQIGISEKEIKSVNEIQDGVSIEINNSYVYLTHSENEQREKLINQIEAKGYEQVMEEVAYTWFNRIVAIRFMEVNEYLPTGIRVLSSEDKSKVEPDVITQVNSIVEDLGLNLDNVYKFQGSNDNDGLFKYILIKQCNTLGNIMPLMFEKIQDYSELLLPDNLLVEGNVVSDLVKNVSEDDFKEQVEIIGWLYQYYISEKKDAVFADLKKNKKITKENIPAATQLFTPDWIVKYMVENSLGRLWLEGHPNEELQNEWKYYLEEAKQEADVEAELEKIRMESKNLSPEDITVLDPSMGSGHILVYAFDVLYQIYVSAGYSEREIPRLILEKNIYGLDIDDRAGQLAYFALIMKARSYSRRIFRDMERNSIEVNVCSIQESNGITSQDIQYFANGDEKLKKDIEYLVDVFTDAKEYGSILEVEAVDFDRLENRLSEIENEITDLFNKESRRKLLAKLPNIIKQNKIMYSKYYVCITNPPYMGRRSMNQNLKNFIDNRYVISKNDLFSVFIERCMLYTKKIGYTSMITMHSFMFLPYFRELRELILSNKSISNLVHLGSRTFDEISGEVVQSVSFCIKNIRLEKYKGKYVRLVNYNTSKEKEEQILKENNTYYIEQSKYFKLPEFPIAYWLHDKIINLFSNKLFEDYFITAGQNITGNNEKYLRMWWEVNENLIGLNKKYIPYSKGGSYRRWYGNLDYIINWSEEAINHYRTDKVSRIIKEDYWYKKGISWTQIATKKTGFRVLPEIATCDVGGPSIFFKDYDLYYYFLGMLNSILTTEILNVINPTMNFTTGVIGKIPIIINRKAEVEQLVKENIELSEIEWNSSETSDEFNSNSIVKSSKLLNYKCKLKDIYLELENENLKLKNKILSNENKIDRAIVEIYKVDDIIDIPEYEINATICNREKEIKALISYAVGCMLGRYSLDIDGLAFAGGEFDSNKYKTFKADIDGIIPINDAQYFEDDIVAKFVEFVKVVFGEDTLEENLNYIADTEYFKRKSNETSRDCLRRYFLKGFMEDHLKVYQKRPIYWMFDSGKQNGFKALIYMHRYDESMVAKIRTDYLHSLQRTYEAEISRLENDITSEALSTKEKANAKKRKDTISKQLVECRAYDQVIAHVANQRIGIDLDDGVKVNYQKFQGVEVHIGDGKKDLKADLLFKVKM